MSPPACSPRSLPHGLSHLMSPVSAATSGRGSSGQRTKVDLGRGDPRSRQSLVWTNTCTTKSLDPHQKDARSESEVGRSNPSLLPSSVPPSAPSSAPAPPLPRQFQSFHTTLDQHDCSKMSCHSQSHACSTADELAHDVPGNTYNRLAPMRSPDRCGGGGEVQRSIQMDDKRGPDGYEEEESLDTWNRQELEIVSFPRSSFPPILTFASSTHNIDSVLHRPIIEWSLSNSSLFDLWINIG